MTNQPFNKKIISEIQERGITPIPKRYFAVKYLFLNLLIVITTLLGSVAMTMIFFILTDHDWDVVSYLDEGWAVHIAKVLPYLWIFVFVIMLVAVYYEVKRSKGGYRYSALRIIFMSLGVSMVLGIALMATNIDRSLDEYFSKSLPLYESIKDMGDVWEYPEQGLLSGYVEGGTVSAFTLRDKDGILWTIVTDDSTIWEQRRSIEPHEFVKIVGHMEKDPYFSAHIIRPRAK